MLHNETPSCIEKGCPIHQPEDNGDILGICTNCGQWVRKSNGNDCVHRCRERGLT